MDHHHHQLRISNTNHDVVHSHRLYQAHTKAHQPPSPDLTSPFGQLGSLICKDFREATVRLRDSVAWIAINYYNSTASDGYLGGDGMGSGFGSCQRSPDVVMAVWKNLCELRDELLR